MSCPFGDDFPGWQIIVEAFYTPNPGRTYGQGTYGSDVYGDLTNTGPTWVDITQPSFSLDVIIGSADPDPVVAVNQFTLQLHDDTGAWWDYATPARYNLPGVGAPIRFGLIDPAARYWPLGTGHVEAIVDQHDTPPRFVEVTAYGNLSWLVTSYVEQLPAQRAQTRIDHLLDVAWWPRHYTVPWQGPMLLADTAARGILVRDELDRSAISSGWFLHETADGIFRFDPWPHRPHGPTLKVSDCPADTSERLAHVITYRADTHALLNAAQMTNTAGVAVESVDEVSIAKYGRRSEGTGFPITGLSFGTAAEGLAIAAAARSRYQDIVNRVESFDADTKADGAWLAELAALDVGRYVQVIRRGVRFYFVEAVVTGYELHLERNRATATVFVSTITPTL